MLISQIICNIFVCINSKMLFSKTIHFIAAALAALAVTGSEASEEKPGSIGQVTLILGQSRLISSEGVSTRLERGMLVSPGDSVQTASNGHVHIRFVDSALMSVRPNSILVIEQYHYDAEDPSESSVKFSITEGVARSISGEAAKAARDRFRLNTPIAAIGVRGTDFVVSSEGRATKALVNEGSIVLAPFSTSCLRESLGPCESNGIELVGGRLQLASLRSNDLIPTLGIVENMRVPGDLQRQLKLLVSSPQSDEPTLNGQGAGDVIPQDFQNEVRMESVTTPVLRTNAQVAVSQVAKTDFIPEVALQVSDDGAIDNFDYTPPQPLASKSLTERQLVWGRYADSPLLSDRLALDYDEAIASRSITVGNLEYGLFRSDGSFSRTLANQGLVGFQLTSAQAVYNSNTGIAIMRVADGSLDINFQDNSFQTMLSLGHDLTGDIEFTAEGKIFDGGFLRSIEASQRLAGAISFDGSEAGYFFEKGFGSGSIFGLTLWDSE